MKPKKRRGGLPSRERVAVLIRPGPEIVAGLDQVAQAAKRSRSQIIEQWLAALIEAHQLAATAPGKADPTTAVQTIGELITRRLYAMGVLPDLFTVGLEWNDQERRKLMEKRGA